MATGAGLAEWEQTHGKKKAKCVLTSTGLLMEGVTHGLRPDSRGGFAANIRTAIGTGRFNRPCRDFDYGQIEVDSRIVGG